MIPEIAALDTRPHLIRIPHQIDVPLTRRAIRLIDTPAFQRLSRISQLGLVSLVYPGAQHSRFEHSLGVYRNVLLFVRRLSQFDAFRELVNEAQIEALLIASLLHDIGHWPFCHPIEDIGLSDIPAHESVAAQVIRDTEIWALLSADWDTDCELVIRLLTGNPQDRTERLLGSIISGPIDIDKMDYLYRDSLHCGVPYGMNFDASRLINSICINQTNDGIAISSKGKTAAEMMVFARYVMFSEVYWHHAVRSATAMFQRVFLDWHRDCREVVNLELFSSLDEYSFRDRLRQHRFEPTVAGMRDGLFGNRRQLYKRLLDYNSNQNPRLYRELSHRPLPWLRDLENRLADNLTANGREVARGEILIDAPPPGLEVQFKVQVCDDDHVRPLEQISPVVDALARKQFDDFVKRVRVLVHPRLVDAIDVGLAETRLEGLMQAASG